MNDRIQFNILPSETNALKGVAIIAMLVHHLFYSHPEYGYFVHQAGLLGKICVAIFLFLSGYGLSVQYIKLQEKNGVINNENTLRFVCKRLIKFYINYWVVFFIFVPIGIFIFNRHLYIPYGDENVLKMLIRDFWGLNSTSSYINTWWFNKLIITLYVLFPFIITFFSVSSKRLQILVLIMVFFLKNYFPFVLGVFVVMNIKHINVFLEKLRTKYLLPTATIVLVIFLYLRNASSYSQQVNGHLLDGLIVAILSFYLVAVVRIRQRKYLFLPLSYLGKHSMNIYLVHTFVYLFYPNFVYGSQKPLLIFGVLLVSSLIISITLEFFKSCIGVCKLQDFLIKKIQQ